MNEWTEAELALLRLHIGTQPAHMLAPIIGRKPMAIRKKCADLKLKGYPSGSPSHCWTPEKIEALKNIQPGISARAFGRIHGIDNDSVRNKAAKLGIKFLPPCRWTKEDVSRLRQLVPTHTAKELSIEFHRNPKAIHTQCQRVGIHAVPEIERSRQRRAAKEAIPKEPKAARPPKPMKEPAPKPIRLVSRPAKSVYRPALEYCSQCHAPVSNWGEHFERMGHRRPAA